MNLYFPVFMNHYQFTSSNQYQVISMAHLELFEYLHLLFDGARAGGGGQPRQLDTKASWK